MPEPATQTDATVIPGADDLHSLETRLQPDELASLDEMNKGFGGPQLGDPETPAAPPVKPGSEPPVEPAPPAAKPPTEPAMTTFDEFTPPDDLPAATEKVAAPTEKAPAEVKLAFKSAAEIMPDAEIDKLRTDRQKTNIRELRSNYDKAIEMLKESNGKIEAFTKAGPDARITDLEARNAQLNAIVERKALEEHPWVQKTFNEPRANAVAYGHKALEMAKLDPKSLDKIMGMSGEERVSALDALYESIESPTLRSKVEKAVTIIEANDDQKAAFFADREANFARLKVENEAAEKRNLVQQEQNCRTAVDQIVQHLAKEKGFSFLATSDRPGAEKWNEGIKSDVAKATDFLLKNADATALITAVVLGMRAPRMQVGYNALRQKLAALEGKAAESRNGSPRVQTESSGPRGAGSAGDPNEGLLLAGRRAMQQVLEQ